MVFYPNCCAPGSVAPVATVKRLKRNARNNGWLDEKETGDSPLPAPRLVSFHSAESNPKLVFRPEKGNICYVSAYKTK
jgi:hypothetical protein